MQIWINQGGLRQKIQDNGIVCLCVNKYSEFKKT